MQNTANTAGSLSRRSFLLPMLFIVSGGILYFNLQRLADWLVYGLLGWDEEVPYSIALHFFLFQLPKVLLLLAFIIFLVGIVRSFFSPEKTRRMLEGKSLFTGNLLASLLGVVTPFCSCSAVPLFIGFVETGIPLGVTFSFLIAAPMINEVAFVLLLGSFGPKVALLYLLTGLCIAISAGWIIGKLNPVHWVEPWVYQVGVGEINEEDAPLNWGQRLQFGADAMREIFQKVWPWVVAGIGIGALVQGYVPANSLVSLLGSQAWYSVPLAVLIGVPLYACAGGVIPIIGVLLEKGVSLGTALAFAMSIIGLSLPEIIILKKVLKLQLIGIFLGVVALGIILVGFLFNWLV